MRTNETDLGSIIKAARLHKGMTQDQLAEKVGVGLRQMQSIENEGGYPSYEVLCNIIRTLTIPADSIFYPEYPEGDASLKRLILLLSKCDKCLVDGITALVEIQLAEKEAATE